MKKRVIDLKYVEKYNFRKGKDILKNRFIMMHLSLLKHF